MYTRCPKCKTAYRITPDQMRAGRGEALCQRCQIVFNAASGLSGTVHDASSVTRAPFQTPILSEKEAVIVPEFEREHRHELGDKFSDIAWEEAKAARYRGSRANVPAASRFPWGLGTGVLLLSLLAQAGYFERAEIVRNVHLRPWLESVCAALHCRLPPFRDLGGIRIIDRSLRITPDQSGYEFRMVFANEAAFAQAYPALRLALTELGGRPLAERVFQPSEYLPSEQAMSPMPVGQPVEIDLFLAKPAGEVGGFSFDLM